MWTLPYCSIYWHCFCTCYTCIVNNYLCINRWNVSQDWLIRGGHLGRPKHELQLCSLSIIFPTKVTLIVKTTQFYHKEWFCVPLNRYFQNTCKITRPFFLFHGCFYKTFLFVPWMFLYYRDSCDVIMTELAKARARERMMTNYGSQKRVVPSWSSSHNR